MAIWIKKYSNNNLQSTDIDNIYKDMKSMKHIINKITVGDITLIIQW